jgi:adenylyltransferase/sulfurtransferase
VVLPFLTLGTGPEFGPWESIMNDPVRITAEETAAAQEDRFHRFRLIGWWDQARLARARVLVVGAGALGNEIVKNLALLGVGQLFIADLDRIENANLSRSVLFRGSDRGRFKAETAARAARDLYPDIRVHHANGNAVYDLGMGVFRWADVTLAGLDNREARLAINRACYRVNRPWIDGAIEQIQGCARVFIPDGPCYECTMSALDWQLLQRRRSCNLLSRAEMEEGKTPTTPTISSIIAGVQCQEALKLLHGLPAIAGRGWVLDGLSMDSYLVEYQRKEECYSHDTLEEVIPLDAGVGDVTAGQLLKQARRLLGPAAELELGRDVLEKLVCPRCRDEEMRPGSTQGNNIIGRSGANLGAARRYATPLPESVTQARGELNQAGNAVCLARQGAGGQGPLPALPRRAPRGAHLLQGPRRRSVPGPHAGPDRRAPV